MFGTEVCECEWTNARVCVCVRTLCGRLKPLIACTTYIIIMPSSKTHNIFHSSSVQSSVESASERTTWTNVKTYSLLHSFLLVWFWCVEQNRPQNPTSVDPFNRMQLDCAPCMASSVCLAVWTWTCGRQTHTRHEQPQDQIQLYTPYKWSKWPGQAVVSEAKASQPASSNRFRMDKDK